MSCGEIQVRLADDVLGEAGVDHDEVAAHLAGCAVCAEERRAFEELELGWLQAKPHVVLILVGVRRKAG